VLCIRDNEWLDRGEDVIELETALQQQFGNKEEGRAS
jgi:hypothetical protein